MAGLSIFFGKTRERDTRLAVQRPSRGPTAQSPLELRIGVLCMSAPMRIVAFFQQAASIDRDQLRQQRMHAGAMQALVVVLPKYLPIALDGLDQCVPDDQFRERPGIEPIQGQIENLLKRRRTLRQSDEDEPIPFPDAD